MMLCVIDVDDVDTIYYVYNGMHVKPKIASFEASSVYTFFDVRQTVLNLTHDNTRYL